ncbi:MAG: heme-binding protein [Nitrosomonadaceae bacterium]|jgi:hypothetical protein|nr:heme-binding protein [Nitrosomonadaceae bacterium]
MKLHIYFLILFSTFSFISPMNVMAAEEPKYELIEKSGEFELRQYQPMLIAEVLVDGDMDQASGKGFRLIADYIFGNNITETGSSKKIKMTAPVTIEPRSEEISMTIPVSLKNISGRWQVSFVMPSKYTLDTIPLPNNKQIMLRKVPARKVAVLEFSGFANEKNTANRTQELLKWMDKNNLISTGSIELSRYDPPWTLPFLRRNEIIVEYAKSKTKKSSSM